MISEADLQEMRAADRELDRESKRKRTLTEAQRQRVLHTTLNWKKQNPDRARAHARAYQLRHRDLVNAAQRKRYRRACEKAVPNEALTAWRTGLGLKQGEAAAQLGVSQSSLSTWERGIYPTPEWVMERIRGGREEVHHEADGAEAL